MRRLLLIISALVSCSAFLVAQEEDTTYSFILSGGGGFTKNASVFQTIPEGGGVEEMGFSGTLRLMWKPEYLLRAGLETGYTHIYTIEYPNLTSPGGPVSASAAMTAVPILLTLSMPLWEDFELFVGGGTYVVTSHLVSGGFEQNQTVVSMGRMVSLAYARPLSENLRIGTEAKWLYMDKFQDNNFSVQFMFYYTLSKY